MPNNTIMAENGGLHMPNRTLVPDKLQGYLLQVRHMLYELISVDDRIVSLVLRNWMMWP